MRALGVILVLVLIAPAARAGDLISVPLRWCAVKGSPAVTNPGGVGEPDTDNALWRRHERASDKVWIPGAGITFRSGFTAAVRDQATFPVIDDPNPPPNGPGGLGDIVDGGERDQAVAACDAAWSALATQFNTALVGPVAVNIRNYVDASGNALTLRGRAGVSYSTSGNVCTDPSKFTTAKGWAVITDYSFTRGFDPDDRITAHELGHALALSHGNGLDDANTTAGVYESPYNCDSLESNDDENSALQSPATIMQPSANKSTSLVTALQKGTTRGLAKAVPGVKIDPPGVIFDGDVTADERVDAVRDVGVAALDILSAGIAANAANGETLFFHRLFGPIPVGAANDYLLFVDADGNPATGGAPSTLGFDTAVVGIELVTKLSTSSTGGEFPTQLANATVWRFVGGAFSQLVDPAIRGEIEVALEGETHQDAFATVAVHVPTSLVGSLTGACGVRIEALTRPTPTGGTMDGPPPIDRLPDASGAGTTLCPVSPTFPTCIVTPGTVPPGGAAIVDAEGLVPEQIVKVIVGDDMVASGVADADGKASVLFAVPLDSPAAPRLVTVGSMGTALTADCVVQVEGTPVHQPAVRCPAAVTAECAAPSGTSVPLQATVTDPDGDPLTVTWKVDGGTVKTDNVPAGGPPTFANVPMSYAYARGAHTVEVRVSDGATTPVSCTTSVTIRDTQPPTVTCRVSIPLLTKPFPPSHDLRNVGLVATAVDACQGTLTPTVSVVGDEDDEEPTGDGVFSPDARDLAGGTLRLRHERKGNADGRVYLIRARASDASSNGASGCCTVAVPMSLSAASIRAVQMQAARALTTCPLRPAGYFDIGDGIVIGPKQ